MQIPNEELREEYLDSLRWEARCCRIWGIVGGMRILN